MAGLAMIEADAVTAELRASAVLGLTGALARNRGRVTDAQLELARICGLTDDEIVELVVGYARGRRTDDDRAGVRYS